MALFLKHTPRINEDMPVHYPALDFDIFLDWLERLILQILDSIEPYNSRVMPRI